MEDQDLQQEDLQQERIEKLLIEFESHRTAIKVMVTDLEGLKQNIEKMFPEKYDSRYRWQFEEKIKTLTALFNSLLEMRKEIAKSVKDEIDIRRRIKEKSDNLDFEDLLDVRKMARKIDIFKGHADKMRGDRFSKSSDEPIDESIVIPGLSDQGETNGRDKEE